jgi:glycosyltransferase involved in cell wall biosynthesis
MSLGIRAAAAASGRNRFIAVSQSTAHNLNGSLLAPFLRWRTHSLLNAVDSAVFSPDSSARASLRAELGIDEDCSLIVHIGQIAHRKDQLGAVRAFHQFVERGQNAMLLLVGSPVFEGGDVYLRKVQAEARLLNLDGRVRFLGQRKDVSRIMQGSDLVVLNSLHDPCPLTVLEAMAAGAPILASRVDGIPELIEDGRTGWLANPGDPGPFASRMLEIFQLPTEERAAVGRAAKAEVQRHSFDSYMTRFGAITRQNSLSTAALRRRAADAADHPGGDASTLNVPFVPPLVD